MMNPVRIKRIMVRASRYPFFFLSFVQPYGLIKRLCAFSFLNASSCVDIR